MTYAINITHLYLNTLTHLYLSTLILLLYIYIHVHTLWIVLLLLLLAVNGIALIQCEHSRQCTVKVCKLIADI